MLSPNSKYQGTQSLGACMAALMKFGQTVLLPIGDNERYDLVLEHDGKFTRIQAKTGRLKNGVVKFSTSSTNYIKGKWKRNNYIGQVDAFIVYCPDNDKTYYLPISDISANCDMSLRIEPAKNNQRSRVIWAKDYEI